VYRHLEPAAKKLGNFIDYTCTVAGLLKRVSNEILRPITGGDTDVGQPLPYSFFIYRTILLFVHFTRDQIGDFASDDWEKN
jgi:hypothetical protein